MATRHLPSTFVAVLAALALAPSAGAQRDVAAASPLAGSVVHQNKVSQTAGGFTGQLTGGIDPYTDPGDLFGISVAPIGDVDHDGIGDLAVGAYCDDEGGTLTGAIWILFMNADQTVRTQQKISKYNGNFAGPIHKGDLFGWSLAGLGDVDHDGTLEVAVGSWLDDDGLEDAGAVWILSLNTDGTVQKQHKISLTQGGFNADLDPGERFGTSIVNLGDLDGDGVTDMAVGAVYDQHGGHFVGAEFILFLRSDFTVKGWRRITNGWDGFADHIDTYSRFGYSSCSVGDLDGDGVVDLAVGAITQTPNYAADPTKNCGCSAECGSVWIVYLNSDGTVKDEQRIGQGEGGFTATIGDNENLAHGVACPGDLDGDGVQDLVVGDVGGTGDLGGGTVTGKLWVWFLQKNGHVKGWRLIDSTQGGFTGQLDLGDFFGQTVTALGDLDGDGIGDFAVGAIGDDDGGQDKGAFWFVYPYGPSWAQAGPGSPGVAGVPKLDVTSSLVGGAPIVLRLEQAAPAALVQLLISVEGYPVPFKGGVLVPALAAPNLMLPLYTDAKGQLQIPTTCPAGMPSGLRLYLQAWIKDAAGTGGLASSTTLRGTVP